MINLSHENEIAILKLNRPEKRNALHPSMVQQLRDLVKELSSSGKCKALIISGEGSAFCAGADLEYLNSMLNYSSIENEKDSESLAEMFLSIYNLDIPTIAAVNGPAIAGGCGLASVCDFIVADSEKAKFGYTEVRIGFIPAIVSIFLMKRVGEGNTKRLLLSGEMLDAAEAHRIGLADIVSEKVLDESLSLARKILLNSLTSYSLTKKMLKNIGSMNVEDAVKYCIQLNTIARSSEDFKERIKKFLNKL